MIQVDRNARGPRDVLVLAFTEETESEEKLALVVQHGFDGVVKHVGIRCLPGCTPNNLCVQLGYPDRQTHGRVCHVHFRYEEIDRSFHGHERLGLPMGAFIVLESDDAEEEEDECPGRVVGPLRARNPPLSGRCTN